MGPARWCSIYGWASKRFPLFAFTNSNPTHQEVWSVRFAVELAVFRSIFVSSELGLRKPEPEAFAVVAARTGIPASELLFFDDGEPPGAGR